MHVRQYVSRFFLLGLFSSYSLFAIAQDETDALRYSFLSTQGTARSIGIGGALGSIGGDFSSLSVNPAGIGVYRSSEFMITPAMRIGSISSTYNRTTMEDNNARFTIGNVGLVFTSAQQGRRYERSKWKAVSFGVGINRVADFNRNYVYGSNINSNSSFVQLMAADANMYPQDKNNLGTFAGIGYESFLLDTFQNQFVSVTDLSKGLKQQRIVNEKGGISDFAISFGGNYMEKLMLGATLSIPSIRYRREITQQETDTSSDRNNYFDNFIYKESLETKGSGINLKLGFIYKPDDHFRIGLAIHTPTYFSLTDNQSQSIVTNTENFKSDLGIFANPVTEITSDDIPLQTYEYNLITPWRTVVSGSAIIGKLGFITADYEYVDYSSARFKYDLQYSAQQAYVNNRIQSTYQAGHNVRIGAEAKMDIFMFRLGFGYYSSPLKAYNAQRMDYSAGIGMRFDSWFIDFGFVNSRFNRQEQPYTLNNVVVPTATLSNSLNNAALTLGFKF